VILVEPEKIHQAISIGVSEDFFGSIPNKIIWKAMKELCYDNIRIDPITLADALEAQNNLDRIGGAAYISQLDLALPDPDSLPDYVDAIRASAVKRKVEEVGKQLTRISTKAVSTEELLEHVHTKIRGVVSLADAGSQHITSAEEAIDGLVSGLKEGVINGTKTGYGALDMLLGGLRPGNLFIVAGRPGMGKTSLALNMAHIQSTRYGKVVGFFSLEMSHQELIVRVLSSETEIPISKIRVAALGDSEWYQITKAQRNIRKYPLYIEDSGGLDTDTLAARARELANTVGLDILYVDYLQLMQSSRRSGNRTEEVSQISRDLKKLAKELNIPIVALSQLNRAVESRPNKRPQLADIRESGSIEQDADAVMFVYRPGEYMDIDTSGGEAELILAKNRSGPTGTVQTVWKAKTNQFLNP
jgi:replicative DNA helicase